MLDINKLKVQFKTNDGIVTAVNGINFSLKQGKTLGIVGESGSGKTQTVLSIMRLLAKNAIVSGSIKFNNVDLVSASEQYMTKLRGNEIAMIFQDPMTCLNPYTKIGKQLMEVLFVHQNISKTTAKEKVLEMMDAVRIPDSKRRFNQYPYEFSGGMRQRIMIAMALLCKPKLLIADEPTTALDVTVQAEIMFLLNQLKTDLNMAIILITHDMGVVAGSCDDVIVMYGGQVMEKGGINEVFYNYQHPYTKGLLASIPDITDKKNKFKDLYMIPGNPPSILNLPDGCPFNDRCSYKLSKCENSMPKLEAIDDTLSHSKACYLESLS